MALKESLRRQSDHQQSLALFGIDCIAVPKGVFSFENILVALAAKVPTKAKVIRLKVI